MNPKIVFSKKCLEYGTHSGHPENCDRVEKAYMVLRDIGFDFIEPKPADEIDLLRVHSKDYLEKLREGKLEEDVDTPAYEEIYEYARLSSGGAILSSEINGFSLMRPPGHHVGRDGVALNASTKGFCYLNNIAIAVRHLNEPTLIFDIDGHHGNGTQEIFLNDDKVIYASIHRDQFYPGTGDKSTGNCLNYPLKQDCGQRTYLDTLEKALNDAKKFTFEYVAVSAGFDTDSEDFASLGLTEESYAEIGKRIASLGKPTFFVLEGGYNADKLGRDILSFLTGFE